MHLLCSPVAEYSFFIGSLYPRIYLLCIQRQTAPRWRPSHYQLSFIFHILTRGSWKDIALIRKNLSHWVWVWVWVGLGLVWLDCIGCWRLQFQKIPKFLKFIFGLRIGVSQKSGLGYLLSSVDVDHFSLALQIDSARSCFFLLPQLLNSNFGVAYVRFLSLTRIFGSIKYKLYFSFPEIPWLLPVNKMMVFCNSIAGTAARLGLARTDLKAKRR